MPRLPSSTDVQNVSPRVAADPGIQAPAGAFQSPVGIVAEELAPGIDKLAQMKLRQDNRRDTVNRSSSINQYNEDVNNKLMRLNTESDLSREDVLSEFGSFMTKRRQELLASHGGSKDSSAILDMRLQDVASSYTGKAAGLSVNLGREKVKTTFKNSINPLIARSGQDPTVENIDDIFLDLETQIDDLREAFDPNEEESLRSAAREEITLNAIDTLITRGRVESAAGLLETGGLGQYLSPENQRRVQRSIETHRFEQDKVQKSIRQAEATLGRPLTTSERAQLVGLKPDKETERELRKRELVDRGHSPEMAQDLASGDVKIMGPDNFGNFWSINLVTNSRRKVGEVDKKIITDLMGDQEGANQDETDAVTKPIADNKAPGTERTLEADIQSGTGPFAKIQTGISNVFGPLSDRQAFFEDTTTAKQRIRTFNQTLKTALVNNPRFPVAEQEIVAKALPDVEAFFKDPDTAVADAKQLRKTLEDFKTSKNKELKSKNITSERRGELADQVSRLDEALSLMTFEKPKQASGKSKQYSEKAPEGVPKGSKQIGRTKSGNPVWETPDGERFEVVP